jgi:hypothetical protein
MCRTLVEPPKELAPLDSLRLLVIALQLEQYMFLTKTLIREALVRSLELRLFPLMEKLHT